MALAAVPTGNLLAHLQLPLGNDFFRSGKPKKALLTLQNPGEQGGRVDPGAGWTAPAALPVQTAEVPSHRL
jgi:hypothetical protein